MEPAKKVSIFDLDFNDSDDDEPIVLPTQLDEIPMSVMTHI